jgi:hypothetical protein
MKNRGQGLFYLKGSHSEPLINLEMGPQCEVVTFLIDSGISRSSLCLLPRGLIYFLERTLISGIKGESISVKILQETHVYFQDRTTSPRGRYQPIWERSNDPIMTQLGISLHVKKKKVKIQASPYHSSGASLALS